MSGSNLVEERPAQQTKRSAGILRRLAVVLLPLLALAIFAFTVALIDRSRTIQRELHPWPDGPEYVDGAFELAARGEYRIHVGGESHPPRYPPGYSAVLAVFILLGVPPVDAPYRLNLLCGALLVGLLYVFLARGGRWVRAGLGALLLAALPAFSILCRSPMSDLASACLTFGSVAALYLYAGGRRRGLGVLGAWLLGVSVCFRFSNLFLLPFAFFAVVGRGRFESREPVRFGAALGFGMLPLLLYNWSAFGSPLESGYGYWLGQTPADSFAFENAVRYGAALWRELAQTERELNTASIYGANSYFGPAAAVLWALGLMVLRRDRRNLSFLTAGVFSVIPLTLFDFADFRFLLPQLAMLCGVAAAGATRLIEGSWTRRRWAAAGGLLLLVLAAVTGWPGARSDTEMGDMIRPRAMFLNVSDPDLLQELEERFGQERALVLSDLPPPLLHALTGGAATAAPLLNDHNYRFNPEKFMFEDRRRRQMIERARGDRTPTLALCARCRIDDLNELAPPPPGLRWRVLVRNAAGGGLAQLGP